MLYNILVTKSQKLINMKNYKRLELFLKTIENIGFVKAIKNISLIERYRLRKEKLELINRREYLLANGFPIVFNGKDKIQDRLDEIELGLK